MYSKSTENLKLPQWEATDHPAFLTDMNQAFKKIDDAVGPQGESLAELQNKVALLSDLSTSQQEDIEQLRNDVSDHGVQIANLQGKVAVLPEIKNQIETANTNYRVLHAGLDSMSTILADVVRKQELVRNVVSFSIDDINFSMQRIGNIIYCSINNENLSKYSTVANIGNNTKKISGDDSRQYFDMLGISDVADLLTHLAISVQSIYTEDYGQLIGQLDVHIKGGENPEIGLNYIRFRSGDGVRLNGAPPSHYIVQKIKNGVTDSDNSSPMLNLKGVV